jgi:polyhydroxyalkanoate synthase
MHKITSDEFLANCQKVGVYYQEILTYILNKNVELPLKYPQHNEKYQQATTKIFEQFIDQPEKFTDLNTEYISNLQNLLLESVDKFIGKNQEDSNKHKKTSDKRFKAPEWQQNIYFDFVQQYYLLTSDWIQKTVQKYDLDEDTKQYINFASRQFIDALSPANFAFSNPVVIKESLESGLDNIVKGMENFLEDIKKSSEVFNITTTDKSHFKIGKDIAATKGKIVYQNDLIQLICYEPKPETYSIPLLVVPPCINKYYILDLSENNSLVKWLTDNNFQVFLVSWVNPDKEYLNKDFQDYLQQGVLESIQFIKNLGYKKVNTLGYCIGGTLLAAALSYLKTHNDNSVASATFLTTLIDFSKPGEIGTFINDHTFKAIEQEVNDKGYLDGRYLSNSFSLIRANDLVWSFFVNNYLLGKAPTAFDILYWNSDSTNLPAKMYIYYLKNMYIDNKLKEPGALEMLNTKIDVTEIDLPTFSVAAKTDHIALWDSVYDGYKILGGDKTFCLTDAGHVAGVVNPAINKKYSYRVGKNIKGSAESWLKSAQTHQGSWWCCWKRWLASQSDKKVKSINYGKIKTIEPAPGKYVRQTI